MNDAWNSSHSTTSLLSSKAQSNHAYLVILFGLEITALRPHCSAEIFLGCYTLLLLSSRLSGASTSLNVTFGTAFYSQTRLRSN